MSEKRIYFIFSLFFIFSLVIFWRLYSLQIKNGEYWQAIALGQQVSFKEQRGERGEIFLNNQEPLAQNVKKFIAYIFPSKVAAQEKERVATVLGKIFNLEKEEILAKIEQGKIFKKTISAEAAKALKQENLQGVFLDTLQARLYSQGSLASHLLGFVNREGKGQYGIEGYYDEVLQGEKGFARKGRAPLGYLTLVEKEENFASPQPGADLFLSLDYEIQYFAEKLLEEARGRWKMDSGEILVLNPQTGKVLAAATLPGFDPNQYFKVEDFKIFQNGLTQKLFEPGSIFKPITMAAGLQEKVVTEETVFEDKGYVETSGPLIYNYKKRVWGQVSMNDVLKFSINTGAVFVQQKLGRARLLKYIKDFGFFEKTGIDLQGEAFSRNENLQQKVPRDVAVASFGQSIEITSMQLARSFSALANGGTLIKPLVVEKIIHPDGKVTLPEPEIGKRVISSETASRITTMLVSVVEEGYGSAARIPGYLIAGKTGTAEIPQRKGGGYVGEETVQSFIGYFPALNPQFLILIKLDNPQGVQTASVSAAPLFRDLAKHIIDLKQIPPDY